jgi:hypothetical protein
MKAIADKDGKTDFETMLNWIYNIPPGQRKVDYQFFLYCQKNKLKFILF